MIPITLLLFEAQTQLLTRKIHESRQEHTIDSTSNDSITSFEENTIEITPEEDLISLNALGYSLRVDPNRVRRWLENDKIKADGYRSSGVRGNYYFRRDRIEQIRTELQLETKPASSEEWRQEFLDFAKSRNLSKSYKPVMVKAVFKLVDRDGKVKMDDLVKEFRDFYVQRAMLGLPVEYGVPLLKDPTTASDRDIMRLIIRSPHTITIEVSKLGNNSAYFFTRIFPTPTSSTFDQLIALCSPHS